MNKVIMIGNLANDPEAYTTQSGISRSTFRLAVQRRYANAEGVREADFFTVVAWRNTADFCNKYLRKGRKIGLEGSIQTRSYETDDGQKRWVTEIIADSVEGLGSSKSGDPGPEEPPAPKSAAEKTEQQRMDLYGDFDEVDDDELPF